jgi:nucleotide-binding universal stress UspA family protein
MDASVFPPQALAQMKERRVKQAAELFEHAQKVAAAAKSTYSSKATFETKELAPSENRRRAIVDACSALKADVLVLGSLGAGAIRRGEDKVPYDEQRYQQYYTTVATIPDFAMHNAPCPVFIVRPKTQ